MKKHWIVIVSSMLIVLVTACNDDTSGTSYNDKDTTTTTTTIPTEPPSNVVTTYNVPEQVKTDFTTKYPNASSVQWSAYQPYDRINWEWTGWPVMDTSYHAVTYTINDRTYLGWWDRNNNWVASTATLKDSTMLPDAVKKAIQKNFSGYSIVSIDEENDKNKTAYEIKLQKGDARATALIDSNGKVLKKKIA